MIDSAVASCSAQCGKAIKKEGGADDTEFAMLTVLEKKGEAGKGFRESRVVLLKGRDQTG